MKKLLAPAAICAALVLGTGFASAQDAPAASDPAPAAQTRSDTPEYDVFAKQFASYRDNLKKLRQLKADYQTATPEERDKIIAQFDPLVEATAVQQKELVPTAIKAYRSVEGQNDELRAFLCAMVPWSVGLRENYELGYEVAKCVLDYPLPPDSDTIYAYAAFAAFCTMNLEDAEKWRDVAEDKNVLSKIDPQEKMQVRNYLERVLPMYKEVWAKEQKIREKEASEELPRVLLKTSKGDIVLELFINEAPNAVNNFLSLVDKQFYTDVPFHRVLPFFMAQGGDPTGTGAGGPGYCIPCECYQDNARDHFRGSLSMAHAGRNTGGSQFFITFVPTFFLNGKHTVFGRVVEGMDVLSDINRIDPEQESEEAPDKIIEAKILRGKPGEFKKLPERGR